MAMRIRRINGILVALCAAKTTGQLGDSYIDDEEDHAIRVKLERDFDSEGLMIKTPYRDCEEWCLMKTSEAAR